MTESKHLLADMPLALGISALGTLYKKVDDETARATMAAAWDCGLR